MKYGINIFNNLKGWYNLLVFNTREEALNEDDILENFKFVSNDVKVLFDNEYVTIPY